MINKQKSLSDSLKHLNEAKLTLYQLLKDKIDDIPMMNPDISVLNTNPKIFTVKSSTIIKNKLILNPEYYDYEKQKQLLISVIDNSSSIETIVNKFSKIVLTGKLNEYRFCPYVIQIIGSIVEEMEEV